MDHPSNDSLADAATGSSAPGGGFWLWFEFSIGAPAWNMAMDEALLENAAQTGAPVLRFYGWTRPAASFGYSQRHEEAAQATRLRPLVRRPTGGGLVPHDADWTYSLAFPPSHAWHRLKAIESYKRIHAWICGAFAEIGVSCELAPNAIPAIPGQCFAGAEQFDVLWHGRKIAGAAQRRNRHGLLIQGSIQPPPVPLDRFAWQEAMRRVATRRFRAAWKPFEVPESVSARAERLSAEKYSLDLFTRKR